MPVPVPESENRMGISGTGTRAGTGTIKAPKCRRYKNSLEAHLKDHGVADIVDVGKVSLDGRDGTVNIYELRDNAVRREQEAVASFSTFDAHSLMLFQLATLQLDVENAANVMLGGSGGKTYPFAIDGGLSAPDQISGIDLNAPCWLKWPQADAPWDQAVADKLARVDVKTQTERFREILQDLPLTLEEAAIRRLQGASLLTQICAKRQLTPRQTFDIVLNQLEGMVREAEKNPDNFTESLRDQLNGYLNKQRP